MRQLFVLGDSISIDYGPFLAEALAEDWNYQRKEGLGEALQDLDVPSGANGGDSGMVLRYLRLRAELDNLHPHCLLVNAGLHDIKRDRQEGQLQVSPTQYQAHLAAIIALAEEQSWPLAWVRSTPVIDAVHNRSQQRDFFRYAADSQAYNAIADTCMRQAAVPIADLHGFTLSLGGAELFRDHVHYHPATAKAQGTWLAGWLEEHFPP